MPSAYTCPVLAQLQLKWFPADSQGNPAPGTLSNVQVALCTINGGAAPDPTAYIREGDERTAGHLYLQSTDNVGDVLEFEIKATLTTAAGAEDIAERITLTVVNQLDDHQYRAIGTVAVAWALLEDRIHMLFAAIVSVEANQARLIASRVRRIEVLFEIMQTAAIQRLDQAACDEMKEIATRVKELEALRNAYIHAVWWRSGDPWVARGQLKTRPQPKELGPVAISNIAQLAHDLNAANSRIIAFQQTHNLRTP